MAIKTYTIWFPAKKNGWGWGKPIAWQGWVVLVAYFACVAAISLTYDPKLALQEWTIGIGISTCLLLLVYWLKGESPSWTWKPIDKEKRKWK